ncbi:hypothetical protein BDD12DRAFT_901843 [Trichophaea hybrida]|nr:hypothetical protein BDD12DRAFT_901843 [Trichophaea hybrida]
MTACYHCKGSRYCKVSAHQRRTLEINDNVNYLYITGLQLQFAEILKQIPLPPPPLVPVVSEEEEEVEDEDDEITEAIEDELFKVNVHDLEEEVAARIMMQDEIDGGDRDRGICLDGDFGFESELLQDLDFDD